MLLPNKNYVAYLGALTLLFSYAEMLLPRTVPFFRLGLGNIVILLALSLDAPSFILLCIIKAFAASLMGGTLFSPFFILSLAQSFCSGIVMYVLYKVSRRIPVLSLYGISALGATISVIVQIQLASLYLGQGVKALMTPMLLFSFAASLITAFFAIRLHIPLKVPTLTSKTEKHSSIKIYVSAICICTAAVFTLMLDSIVLLTIAFLLSLLFQQIAKRRFLLLPHLSMWLFVILSNLLSPSGRVLYAFSGFSFTEGAFFIGVLQALKLSSILALSQSATAIKPTGNSIFALSLRYFGGLSHILRSKKGNIFVKIHHTLAATHLEEPELNIQKSITPYVLSAFAYIGLFVIQNTIGGAF